MNNVTSWKLLTSTQDAWEQLMEASARAEKSIDIEQYIFGDSGAIIDELTAVLREKVQQGVRVRLLLDAIGSFAFYRSALRDELQKTGIEIVFHSTIAPPSFKRLIPFFLRDHRKLIVIDGAEAHVSGTIIEERARAWRDTSVILEGDIVEDCATQFNLAWEKAIHSKPVGRMLSDEGKGEFFLAGNSFHLHDKHLYRSILENIRAAKKTIYVTTPYFVLMHDLRRALWSAKRKGVEIHMLFPKRSDNFFADILARFFYRRMLRKGIKIFHYTKSILHAKSISIDGAWATVGSCNIDWLSMWLNYELNVVSANPAFASELEAIFLRDRAESQEVTAKTGGWYGLF